MEKEDHIIHTHGSIIPRIDITLIKHTELVVAVKKSLRHNCVQKQDIISVFAA